jgi:hypothetical protein
MFRGTRARGCGRVPGLSWARRSRPGPPGAHPPAPAAVVFPPVHLNPRHMEVAGSGALPNPGVARATVPDAGARPCRTRPPPVWVPLDWLWSRSRPLAAPGIWGVISGIGTCAAPPAAGAPILLITDLPAAPSLGWSGRDHPGEGWGVEGRDHSRLRSTRTAAVSSRTGVPPSRGRPPTQPQGSVVHPTQPPPQGDGVEVNRREHARAPDHGAGTGRPGPGTARPPAAARPDSTRRIDTIAPDPPRPLDRRRA